MTDTSTFEILATAPPGLEPVLLDEVRENGFGAAQTTPGGVSFQGGWPEVWRANLCLRGAGRILARFAAFPVFHLAQLDKRARRVPWSTVFRTDIPVRVETTCRKSKIYHAGAATERVAGALAAAGVSVSPEATLRVMVRIEENYCTFSIDTSGAPLHRRGFKEEVGKAPMRETLAALFLKSAGFAGTEPVIDPMCGSGTFVIEAAEITSGHRPGRARSFGFEELASFDPAAWSAMKSELMRDTQRHDKAQFWGSDRDAGAVARSCANAMRAGVGDFCTFSHHAISDIQNPGGSPGLVIVNPPYGGRIGNPQGLRALYGALGNTLRTRFIGWRVAVVTSDRSLARATNLPFHPPGPIVSHGGLKIRLYQTAPLSRAN